MIIWLCHDPQVANNAVNSYNTTASKLLGNLPDSRNIHKNSTCAHLAFHICCQQYVPCSNVSVDETLLGEVMHGTSNLPTESQQLLWQLPAVRSNRPNNTQKCNLLSEQWGHYEVNDEFCIKINSPLIHGSQFHEMIFEITSFQKLHHNHHLRT